MENQRNKNGQFAPGNSLGPGRPRRSVEHDYLAALGDAVSLGDWREVVSRAVTDAKLGDAKARDWLTRHLVGSDPPQLIDLAAREQLGESTDEVVEDRANAQRQQMEIARLLH